MGRRRKGTGSICDECDGGDGGADGGDGDGGDGGVVAVMLHVVAMMMVVVSSDNDINDLFFHVLTVFVGGMMATRGEMPGAGRAWHRHPRTLASDR